MIESTNSGTRKVRSNAKDVLALDRAHAGYCARM